MRWAEANSPPETWGFGWPKPNPAAMRRQGRGRRGCKGNPPATQIIKKGSTGSLGRYFWSKGFLQSGNQVCVRPTQSVGSLSSFEFQPCKTKQIRWVPLNSCSSQPGKKQTTNEVDSLGSEEMVNGKQTSRHTPKVLRLLALCGNGGRHLQKRGFFFRGRSRGKLVIF